MRTATFWLRPAFALRVVGRFQRLVGFDRSMALSSAALTAMVPLAVLFSGVVSRLGGKDTAERLIDRYGLTGDGADAVRHLLTSSTEWTTLGLFGVAFLVISVLSFARAAQRLFEQNWELEPLSVRNTVNGLKWIGLLAADAALSGWIHAALGHRPFELAAALVVAPLTAVFLVWSGRLLSAVRITPRDLLPFGVIGAVALTGYSVAMSVYMPRLFNSSTARYGAIGAVFAMLSALFGAMFAVVASAALGAEVREELDRIGRGERPPDDEVRKEWDTVLAQARSRWEATRGPAVVGRLTRKH
ncbi:YhjD/YihY/BrkB family envelope integrity protein [Yinghuangia seranimata]|uniref:YhjD/YihY/BrkB family envelope integrity protein n=1 Tax=Yinghuangia seranimata TaxID=408067 RepID=UPI00248CC9EB|nr:YhjD/YihY/BrkB family envelope integrity protein [Yinghuangia seranimata]MDI2127730.1 YhjD/YihY/BrkB family envelope integrity protein [Yinghuangia seranimata]